MIIMSTVTADTASVPAGHDESFQGSSVSSGFINEYEEILKFAVVAPKLQIGGDGFLDIDCKGPRNVKQVYADSKHSSKSASPTSSSDSDSTSNASTPAPFETGQTVNDGEVEIKVMKAKRAIEQQKIQYRTKTIEKSTHQQVCNAMETLLGNVKLFQLFWYGDEIIVLCKFQFT